MDLGTMEATAQRGGYADADAVRADMALIVSNCKAYNTPLAPAAPPAELFSLVDRIAARLDAELSRAVVGGTGSGSGEWGGVSVSQQVVTALVEPHLVRALVQATIKTLFGAAAAGTRVSDSPALTPLLALLAAGDLAFAQTSSTAGSAAAAEGGGGGGTGAGGVLAAALCEIVGASVDGSSAAPLAAPLPLLVVCAILERAIVDAALEGFAGGGGAQQPSLDELAAAAASRTAVVQSMASIRALQCGVGLHSRSARLLCAVVGSSAPVSILVPAHLERALSLWGAGESGLCASVFVTALMRAAGALASALNSTPAIPPALLATVAGTGADAPLTATALALTVFDRFALPGLETARGAPGATRALLHEQVANFMRFCLDRCLIAGGGGGDGERVLMRALLAAAPNAEDAAAAVRAAVVAAGASAAVSDALISVVSPLALVWTRPDFERARAAYVRLVIGFFPRFSWASVGLSPEAAVLSALPTGSPQAFGGDAGSDVSPEGSVAT